jgi:predicted ferric reductase
VRLLLPLGALLTLLTGPFLLAEAGGWNGQRSFSEELGSTLAISALSVLEIVLLLPTRLHVLARLGADTAVRLHRHLVGVLIALLVGHIALAVALRPARDTLLRFVDQPWRAQAAIMSVLCLLALIGLSIWRRRLRIPYSGGSTRRDPVRATRGTAGAPVLPGAATRSPARFPGSRGRGTGSRRRGLRPS